METPSLGGKKYLITFIDEYSHFAFVYLLKTKDEAAIKYTEFCAYVENFHHTKIIELRCDNGGEFINRYLEQKLI